jgi:hypothetical protein
MQDETTNNINDVTLPTLENLCQRCEGRGWFDEGDHVRRRCRWCEGAGYEPTEFGERVLALMRHNFGPMLQDAQEFRR